MHYIILFLFFIVKALFPQYGFILMIPLLILILKNITTKFFIYFYLLFLLSVNDIYSIYLLIIFNFFLILNQSINKFSFSSKFGKIILLFLLLLSISLYNYNNLNDFLRFMIVFSSLGLVFIRNKNVKLNDKIIYKVYIVTVFAQFIYGFLN